VRTWFDPAANVHLDSLGIVWSQACGQDVENSEEPQKHKELAHSSGTSDKSTDLEKPDLLGETSAESAAIETLCRRTSLDSLRAQFV
jgi:hypothetical protein